MTGRSADQTLRAMTFVEAALTILEELSAPTSVEDLARLAVERELLSKPGKDPLRSMKGRLTAELNKGKTSRIERVDDGVWALKNGKAKKKSTKKAPAKKAAPKKSTAAKAKKDEAKKSSAKKAPAKKTSAKKASAKKAPSKAKSDQVDDKAKKSTAAKAKKDEAKKDEAKKSSAKKAPVKKASAKASPKKVAAKKPAPKAEPEEAEAKAPISKEEEALLEIYGDESEASSVADINEYRDELTEDEDRELRPEITQPRRHHGRANSRPPRRERKRRRDRSQDPKPADVAAGPSRKSAAAPPPELPALEDRSSLLARAEQVLAGMRGDQAVPLRQLAQMMRKRKLLGDGSPEQLAQQLRTTLTHHNQLSRAAGRRPRVRSLGRDRYALNHSPLLGDAAGNAESSFEAARQNLEAATRDALSRMLAKLSLDRLERIAYLYLSESGWTEINWVKRVGRSAYATCERDGVEALVGVRVGPDKVDRRGVGELRVGVEAKQLDVGLLLSPSELSDEALTEWTRGGKPVNCVCGRRFVDALIDRSIGAQRVNVPVAKLDLRLLDEMTR